MLTETNVRFKIETKNTNKHSKKGEFRMSWIQNNRSLLKVLLFSFIMVVVYLIVTDRDDVAYGKVEVQEGDTLWSLAEIYKGSMSTTEWIEDVKKENDLRNDKIIVGEQLNIPISTDVIYIAERDHDTEKTYVKIASNE